MAKSSILKVGVTDFYVAIAKEEQETKKITYETPEVIGGSASVSVAQVSGENKVYESDMMIRNSKKITGATITHNSHTVRMAEKMKYIYGKTITGEETEFETGPDDVAPNCAVGFAASMSDGSYMCYWYYWCTGSVGDESMETATDAESSTEDSYTWGAMPRPDTRKLFRVKHCANATEKDAFFQKVDKT